jgi:mRNA interferase HigB
MKTRKRTLPLNLGASSVPNSPILGELWYHAFKMRVISVPPLRDFWGRHADVEEPLRAWLADALRAEWKTPHDLKTYYANASLLGNNRVVFNIKGNDYRLIVAVSYRAKIVLVKFIGTHAEYDRVDAENVELG